MCFHASSSWTGRIIIALNFEDSITVTNICAQHLLHGIISVAFFYCNCQIKKS